MDPVLSVNFVHYHPGEHIPRTIILLLERDTDVGMHKGNGFELSFVSNENAPQGIPWEFVRDFVLVMRQTTSMGNTGCYDQGYWNAAGTFGVYVGLRILVT